MRTLTPSKRGGATLLISAITGFHTDFGGRPLRYS
jgi:hypothetical protein